MKIVKTLFCENVDNFEDTIFCLKKFYSSIFCTEYLCEILSLSTLSTFSRGYLVDKFFLTPKHVLYIISMLASLQGDTMPETATIPAFGKCRSSRHSSFPDAWRDMRLTAAAARGPVETGFIFTRLQIDLFCSFTKCIVDCESIRGNRYEYSCSCSI